MRISLLIVTMFAAAICGSAQANADAAVLAEVKAFYSAYADDLKQARREAITERYDRRGTYFLGNGSKALESFEESRRYYLGKWTPPKSFAWKDLEFEVVSPTAVVVIGRFDWATEKEPKAVTCSYTGLVTKGSGQWRIRVEDESCPTPPK